MKRLLLGGCLWRVIYIIGADVISGNGFCTGRRWSCRHSANPHELCVELWWEKRVSQWLFHRVRLECLYKKDPCHYHIICLV